MAISTNPYLTGVDNNNFRGAIITALSGTTSIRDAAGTYAPLGMYTKIRMDTILRDTESCANVTETTTVITAITVGATTKLTLTANPWPAVVGDNLYLSGLTGADAAFLNGQSFVITVIDGAGSLDFTLSVNTTGKTITRTGSSLAGN